MLRAKFGEKRPVPGPAKSVRKQECAGKIAGAFRIQKLKRQLVQNHPQNPTLINTAYRSMGYRRQSNGNARNCYLC